MDCYTCDYKNPRKRGQFKTLAAANNKSRVIPTFFSSMVSSFIISSLITKINLEKSNILVLGKKHFTTHASKLEDIHQTVLMDTVTQELLFNSKETSCCTKSAVILKHFMHIIRSIFKNYSSRDVSVSAYLKLLPTLVSPVLK